MNWIATLASQPWVARLGWSLIHFLWQGALIAGFYAAARNRVIRPHTRYLLACAAMLMMLASLAVTFASIGSSGPGAAHATIARASFTIPSEWSTTPNVPVVLPLRPRLDRIMPWLVMAWFAGAAAFWLRLAGGCIVAARMQSSAMRAASPEWQRAVNQLCSRLRISRAVRLLTSARVDVPTVVGWLRPVVLMPVGALAGLPFAHIEALLAHELAHIRRHDYLVNILQRFAESILFYHPAVWWISAQIGNQREECCDDIAVSIVGDALVYAEVLAGLEIARPARISPARLSPARLSPELAASGGSLEDRIARLLGIERRNQPFAAAAMPAVLVSLVFATAFAVLGQPAPKLAFEVASIKPSPPDYVGFQSYVRGNTYTAMTATVRNLMSYAYGIRDFQISGGPAWASAVGYNISAKIGGAEGSEPNQSKLMLQTLLADRFGLKFHRATKNRSGYALVVDKSGPKLTGSIKPGPGLGLGKGNLLGRGADMRMLASALSSQLEAPIAERTGLTGLFDFTLTWTPDPQPADIPGPSVFSAVKEQLGLRLDPVKDVPVEFFIIDRVHKPSEN